MIRRHANFIKLVVSYLLILIIPLSIAVFAYAKYLVEYSENTIKLYMSTLDRKVSAVDDIFISCDRYIYQLSQNAQYNMLMKSGDISEVDIGSLIYQINQIPKALTFSLTTEQYVLDSLHIFKNSGIISSDSQIYLTSLWSKDFFILGKPMTRWQEILDTLSGSIIVPLQIIKNERVSNTLAYYTTIPMGNSLNMTEAVSILFLDATKLQNHLLSNLSIEHVDLHVLGNKGEHILSTDEINIDLSNEDKTSYSETTLNGEKIVIFHIESAYNGWSYIWILPKKYVYQQTSNMVNITLAIVGMLIVLGVFISFLMAYRGNKPVREILESLKGETNKSWETENEYDSIKGSIASLLKNRETLESRINRNSAIVRGLLIDKLLEGKDITDDSSELVLSQLGLSSLGDGLVVVVVNIIDNGNVIDNISNVQIQRSVILDLISRVSPDQLIREVDVNKIVILHTEPVSVREYVYGLTEMIMQIGHSNVVIGVGTQVNEIYSVYKSYNSAIRAIEQRKIGENIIYSIDSDRNISGYLMFSIEQEQWLSKLIHSGNTEDCMKFLDSVYEQNSVHAGQPQYITRLFLSELICILFMISSSDNQPIQSTTGIDAEILTNLYLGDDLNKSFTQIKECYIVLCEKYNQDKFNTANILVNKVSTYIETFYADKNMGLSVLSEEFNMSEAYLSFIYKEHTGENFSSCLERIRMNKAHELLTNTNLALHIIADKIGYQSTDTFRRAFKRFHGISPAVFRLSSRSAYKNDKK